jgi:hypothetical protein
MTEPALTEGQSGNLPHVEVKMARIGQEVDGMEYLLLYPLRCPAVDLQVETWKKVLYGRQR